MLVGLRRLVGNLEGTKAVVVADGLRVVLGRSA